MDQVEHGTSEKKRRRAARRYVAPVDSIRSAELLTVNQFPLVEPAFTPTGLRWLIFREGKGLAECGALVRFGRRLFLHRQKFMSYVLANKPHA